jgi:hypothetical protein
MRIYRGVPLAVMTASLFFCRLIHAEDPQPGAEKSAIDTSATNTPATDTSATNAPATDANTSATGANAPATNSSAAGAAAPDKTAPSSDSGFEVNTTSYVWLPGMHGAINAGGYNLGYKIDPGKLISNADLGFMQFAGIKYKRFVVLIDFYVEPFTVNKTAVLSPGPIANPIVLAGQVKYTQVMLSQELGYRMIDSPKFKADFITGYRYWHNGAQLNITGPQRTFGVKASTNYADPVVGGRFQIPLSPKLFATIWGDVGGWGAGAQLEYQITSGLTYSIKPRWAVDVGWRYMYTDYGKIVASTLAYSGIAIGVTHIWMGRPD